MIQSHKRSNTLCQECIDYTIIKIQTPCVGSSRSLGKYTRPRNGEAIGIQAQFGHQRYILRHPVVMVCSNVSVLSLIYFARYRCKLIPDGQAAPILVCCAFDLIGCSGCTPEKICGEERCEVSVNHRSWLCVIGYAHSFSLMVTYRHHV